MANEDPTPIDNPGAIRPNPEEVRILLSGNLADDDLLWVVRCSVAELHRMFQSPVGWVAGLGDLPGWGEDGVGGEVPAPVLTHDFAMTVQPTLVEDPDGWVAVQGISHTNALTVVASRESAIQSLRTMDELSGAGPETDPFALFWEEVAKDPESPTGRKPLLVNVLLSLSRFFAHFEILDAEQDAAAHARRIANYLLASVFDPEGEAAMLGGLDQRTLYVKGAERFEGKPIGLQAGPAQRALYANIDASKFSARGDGSDPDPDPDPGDTTSCRMVDGPYTPPGGGTGGGEGGDGETDGGIIKRYGIDAPPSPSGG